ncbi:MAG: hypothetical protein M3R44_03040, partial [Candidatus Eremiobacteraeota bacterium]|nr:hypothetical protein [Candidatus Eremiobacteraeota bacterium]
VTILGLTALGLPGLCGFAGEILILTGLYRAGFLWPTVVALVPIIIAAAYMLRIVQGMMNGPELPDLPQRRDMSPLEIVALAPLVIAIVVLGVNPGPIARTTGVTSMPGARAYTLNRSPFAQTWNSGGAQR